MLSIFERRALKKIFGSIRVNDGRRNRFNYELQQLYKELQPARLYQATTLNMSKRCRANEWIPNTQENMMRRMVGADEGEV